MLTQLSRMSSIRNRIGPNKLKVLEFVFDFGGAAVWAEAGAGLPTGDCEPAPGGRSGVSAEEEWTWDREITT